MKKLKKLNQAGIAGAVEIAILAVLILVVGFTFWNIRQRTDDPSASVNNEELVDDEEFLPDDMSNVKTINEISQISDIGDASIVNVELKSEDGLTVYKLVLSDGRVLYVDAVSGSLVKTETSDDTVSTTALNLANVITVQEAVAKAKDQYPDKKVVKVELEMEDGELVYSVRFADDSRVDVAAVGGEVMRYREEGGDWTKTSSSDDDDSDDNQDDSDDDHDDDSEDDHEEDEEDDEEDNSGSGSSNSGSGN